MPSFVGGFVTGQRARPGRHAAGPARAAGRRTPALALRLLRGAWSALTLFSYPYVFLPVRAPASSRVDPALEEASRSLGKSARDVLPRVNLPQLRPAIAAGAILVALYVLSEFGAVSMLRYDTLTPLVYIQYTAELRPQRGRRARPAADRCWRSSSSSSNRRHEAAPAITRRQSAAVREIVRLGRWRWPALGFCVAVIGLSLGLPASVIVYWLRQRRRVRRSTSRSVERVVELVARVPWVAGAALACALPVAILSVRHPGTLSRVAREARLPRPRATRHHDRARARLLRGELRALALPDARAARLRLRHALPARGARRRRGARCCRSTPHRGGGAQPRRRPSARLRTRHGAADPAGHVGRRAARLPHRR